MGLSDISERVRLRIADSRLGRIGMPRRRWGVIAAVIAVVVALYYPIGMIWIHQIDDDTEFGAAAEVPAASSRAVAIVIALIDREINQNRWTANDPAFMPGAALDNMPNFQQGIVSALARFAFELTDQIGRTRGSSQTDTDLQEAAGLLQYSGTKWAWDPSVSLLPTASSEKQYQKALISLQRYNRRLAEGNAVFERRSDNLLATLDRIALDLGASSATLDNHIDAGGGGLIDFKADDLFYGVKGQTYAYFLLLRALGADFKSVLEERQIGSIWDQMLASMRRAATMQPAVVINGAPDSLILPSHLAAQGFYLLRARTQLREITNILLK